MIPKAAVNALHVAICERLGLDPAVVERGSFEAQYESVDERLTVTLAVRLPEREMAAMFNDAQAAARGAEL